MNAINFLYNPGHVTLWCLEVVPVVYARVLRSFKSCLKAFILTMFTVSPSTPYITGHTSLSLHLDTLTESTLIKQIVTANFRTTYTSSKLKLPSLFDAWLFWTFHTKSHNMKALVILSHSWSPFLPLLRVFPEYFLEKKLPLDYPCKSNDHDYQWAVLVMAWLL